MVSITTGYPSRTVSSGRAARANKQQINICKVVTLAIASRQVAKDAK